MTAPPGGYAACPACNCCFGMRAEITAFDLARLVDALGVDPCSLVEASPASVGEETSFYLDTSGRAFFTVLRRLEAPHRCALLVGPLGGGEYRCGVHAVRPLVCRAYPYELAGGVVSLRDELRCPAGSWAGDATGPTAWRAVLRRQSAETDVQRWMVRRWNELIVTAADGTATTFAGHVTWISTVARSVGPALDALTADEVCLEAWARRLDAGASPLDPRTLGAPPTGSDAVLAPWWDVFQRVGAGLAGAPR